MENTDFHKNKFAEEKTNFLEKINELVGVLQENGMDAQAKNVKDKATEFLSKLEKHFHLVKDDSNERASDTALLAAKAETMQHTISAVKTDIPEIGSAQLAHAESIKNTTNFFIQNLASSIKQINASLSRLDKSTENGQAASLAI